MTATTTEGPHGEDGPRRDGGGDDGASVASSAHYIGAVDDEGAYVPSEYGSEYGTAVEGNSDDAAKEKKKGEDPDRTLETIALGHVDGVEDAGHAERGDEGERGRTRYCCWRGCDRRTKLIVLLALIVLVGAIVGGVIGARVARAEENGTCRVEGDECVIGNICHKWDGCAGEADCCCCEGLTCGGNGVVFACYKP